MVSGSARHVIHPAGCDLIPLARRTQLLCAGPEDEAYLYDLLSGEIEQLPLKRQQVVSGSPDGDAFLLRDLSGTEGERRATFRVYYWAEGREVSWAPGVPFDRVWAGPVLSTGGQRVAFIAGTSSGVSTLYEMHESSNQPAQISLPDPMPGGGLAWSPVDARLAYGALGYVPDIEMPPRFIYVIDTETGEVEMVSEAPDGGVYDEWGFGWSPDGSMIDATSSRSVCVIEVETGMQRCEQIVSDRVLFRDPVWSPSGRHLVTVIGRAWWMHEATLVIIDVNTLSPIPIREFAEGVDALFWR
jgi:Tol biopolymer transport system component